MKLNNQLNKLIPLFLLFIIILSTGCINKNIEKSEKFYLENKYYESEVFIKTNNNDIQELIDNKESFILYTYNNFCALPISCEDIFVNFMKVNNISFVSIPFNDFKKNNIYNKIKYAPTIIIIKAGEIIDYLDPNKDEDFNKYQDEKEFKKWISSYIYLSN